MRKTAGFALCFLFWPAAAQPGPSFDCAKSTTPIEKAICADSKLAAADRELATVYGALLATLGGAAKDHLASDQVRWISYRDACAGDPDSCLPDRLQDRTDFLKQVSDGSYPFVSEHAIEQHRKVKNITFTVDARYPQFDGPSVDFSAVNRKFADDAAKGAAELNRNTGVVVGTEQEWLYEQSFTLLRPSANAVSVSVSSSIFAGGAHPNSGTEATLVDLRSGKALAPEDVFAPGEGWLKEMLRLVTADLQRQFKERPGFDNALEPATLGKLLKEPGHYLYKKEHLKLTFNNYEVGPYVNGQYVVEIPYGKLRPLMRANGPLSP